MQYISGNSSELKLFEMNSGKLLKTFDENYDTNAIKVLQNDNIILDLGHMIKLLDVNTFKVIQTIYTNYKYELYELSNGVF